MALLAVGIANTWPSRRFSGPHNGVLFCFILVVLIVLAAFI